jgi:hypothetical protein
MTEGKKGEEEEEGRERRKRQGGGKKIKSWIFLYLKLTLTSNQCNFSEKERVTALKTLEIMIKF